MYRLMLYLLIALVAAATVLSFAGLLPFNPFSLLLSVAWLTDTANVPPGWQGRVGYIDAKMISEEVPDYRDRFFYISGPRSMVDAFEKALKEMGLPGSQIKVDFFPGYA